ncbi:MAG: ribosome recycling factor [Thermotogae bacterium]|nr:ribosome recycling factor [Thermotogota bacterium]
MNEIYREMEVAMKKAVEYFQKELSRIQVGRPNPAILDVVKVEYYGRKIPLREIASINVHPEGGALLVKPWEPKIIGEVERAIKAANLGLNPVREGKVLRIPIPKPSEERRRELLKLARQLAEETRVHVRNARRDTIEKVRQMEKAKEISKDDRFRAEKEIQKITDRYIERINEILAKKEKEILET